MRSSRLYPILFAAIAAVVVLGAPAASAAPAGTARSPAMCCMSGTHLGGPLYGSSAYSAVRGHADYWSRSGGHREFNVGLWNAGKLAGKTLTVYAAGQNVGTMRVGSDGRCHLHRDPFGPTLSAGATVSVKNGMTLVASGALRRMRMM